jgi:putative transcriptional regulator
MSVAGSMLIARPTLEDGFFGRAVVLMLQHGAEGAFGLVLNRVAHVKAKEFPFAIHVGGPCKFNGFILIHGQEDWVDQEERPAAQICPGVWLGDTAAFKRLIDPPPGHDWRYRVFTGYSGWGSGQLERELADGAWAVVPAKRAHIFETPLEELWVRLVPSSIPSPSLN